MPPKLPATIEDAGPIAKLATEIGTAVASIFIPGASLAQPIINLVIDKYVSKPHSILLEQIRSGGIDLLNDDQTIAFIPMAYRFFEAAKEGEYEHNLRIIAEFITGELKQPIVDPGSCARMAHRLAALGQDELRVLVMAHTFLQQVAASNKNDSSFEGVPFVEATSLSEDPINSNNIDYWFIKSALSEMAGRGFLVADGATRLDKSDECFYPTQALEKIMTQANESILRATKE